MNIVVVGVGYVGLVTGVCFANYYNVICLDTDKEKIKKLKNNENILYEPGLKELIEKNKERLSFTTDYKNSYKEASIIIVCVGTPSSLDGRTDLRALYTVIGQISESITKDVLIIIKSTVPVGTNDEIEKIFKNRVKPNIKVSVASNPEFFSQGTAVNDFLNANRIIVGVNDENSKKIMKELYSPFTKEPYNIPYIEMNRRSAEMTKYASNNFLALKISYINELANLCEKLDVNIDDVTLGMGLDQRIGPHFLKSGIGYGGSCFSKDASSLYKLSLENNSELTIIKSSIDVNTKQKTVLIDKLNKDFKSLKGKTIAVLGLSFKPNTDDVRNAPSIEIIKSLIEKGCIIKAYDPVSINNFKKEIKSMNIDEDIIQYYFDIDSTIKGAGAVLILTEWKEIISYDINNYSHLMKTPYIYDGRNCYDINRFNDTNIVYKSIGRQKNNMSTKKG